MVVVFLGKVFSSSSERDSFVFHNKDNLLDERRVKLFGPIFWGFFIGSVLGIWFSNWDLFWVGWISVPIAVNVIRYFDRQNILIHARKHEDFLKDIEKAIAEEILDPYRKRYFTGEELFDNLPDLTALINHKQDVNLNEDDARFIIIHSEKRRNFESFEAEFSQIKSKLPSAVADALLKMYVRLDLENEVIYETAFSQFIDYVDNSGLDIDISKVKEELDKKLDTKRATELEEKLLRDPSERFNLDKVDSLDGIAFENLLGEVFRRKDYKVKLSPKTGDHGADLVLKKNGETIVVQAKRHLANISNSAIQEIVAAKKFYDADKSMVVTTSSFTRGAKKLAEVNGVELIDREKLKKLLDSVS